jgi:alkanesulfonate monooxygenase SsuD/methylene tetrahydromethanopterin reductase-like flavin-dependent oxidoreductase (luciferase family)
MTLPTMLAHGRAETLGWCRAVDEGPWASLAVPERVTFDNHSWVVDLAAAAALTERVRLWTTIVVLPAHDAVDVAKQVATIDVLSDGRVTLGIGVGGREHDYRALGASFTRRWARMDEQVATMRSLWSGTPPFDGADPVGPRPVQPGGPPLVAGVMGPKATARAARWAAGVNTFTFDGSRGAFERALAPVRAAWTEAGRTDAPHFSAGLWYALGDDAADRLTEYAYRYLRVFGDDFARAAAAGATCAGPDALRRAVDDARAADVDELFLVPTTTDPAELDRTLEVLGDDRSSTTSRGAGAP